jgi:hypothetical protein
MDTRGGEIPAASAESTMMPPIGSESLAHDKELTVCVVMKSRPLTDAGRW